MAKLPGLTINEIRILGRVVDNPEIQNGWAKLKLLTLLPEKQQDGSWIEVEHIVPVLCNNPKTISTIEQFVQPERQLSITAIATSWTNNDGHIETGIIIKTLSLGSKIMFDPDTNNMGGSGSNGGNSGNGYPS
jgi:hypothetical protein